MKKRLNIRILSMLLTLAMLLPTTTISALAEMPPTTNFYISGYNGAEITVYDSNSEVLLYTKDWIPRSRYIQPGTQLTISWNADDTIAHTVLMNDAVYLGAEKEMTVTTPQEGSICEFDLINNAEVDAIISINEPNLAIESGSPARCTLTEIPEKLGGIIELDTPIIEVSYKITHSGEIVQTQPLPADAQWEITNPALAEGENLLQISVLTSNGKLYKKLLNITLADNELDEGDNDGDGLPNWVEDELGTDKDSPDSDGDGLTDYDEIYVTLTDPTKADSVGNGIVDGEQDFDDDGLKNLLEVEQNGDPYLADTDGDGLNDGKEYSLGTKLNHADSDADGLSDAMELQYSMDPLNPDTLADGILDGDRQFHLALDNEDAFEQYGIRPSVELELNGAQLDSLSIEKIPDNDVYLSTEVPGFMGNAFDFSVEGEIDKATMTFEFPKALLGDPDFEPAIYYFDEEAQLLTELADQTITGNQISASVEHFSRYMLLNKKIHSKAWEFEFKFDEDSTETFEHLDIAFVIDSSGSMSSNDAKGVRKTVTNNFVDKLTTGDRAAIIDFDSTAKLLSPFTPNKTDLKTAVGKINSSGGTTLTSGVSMAIDQFTASGYVNDNALKVIIMLTDGEGSYNTALMKKAADNNIIIYTVGLGSSIDANLLKAMAEGTTGNYYHASDADKLYNIFDKIAEESDFGKDSDGDGINDYFEKEMNAGRLRLGTGVSLLGVDYLLADSDSDTLKDGEELLVVKKDAVVPWGKTKIYVKITSNPTIKDTDEDGIQDKDDEFPLYYSSIDYLGSDNHIAYLNVRIEEKIRELGAYGAGAAAIKAYWGCDFLQDDYYTFLKERRVSTTGKQHEDYWNSEWDQYWDTYCEQINSYVAMRGSVDESLHYFRNNLNRAPIDFDVLIALSDGWDLLDVKDLIYHMLGDSGEYNVKLVSSDGKNEAVYNKDYVLLSESNDPANMGTYNFAHPKTNSVMHAVLDVVPYYPWGNVKGVAATWAPDSEKRYNQNTDAQRHRQEVINQLRG